MRHILREISAEQNIHRTANAHLAIKGQARMFGDKRIAAISTNAKQADAAKALLKYLASPDAVRLMKASGLEPG